MSKIPDEQAVPPLCCSNDLANDLNSPVDTGLAMILRLKTPFPEDDSVEAVVRWFCRYPTPLGEDEEQATLLEQCCVTWIAAPFVGRTFTSLTQNDIADLEATWWQLGVREADVKQLADVTCGIFEYAEGRGIVRKNVAHMHFAMG